MLVLPPDPAEGVESTAADDELVDEVVGDVVGVAATTGIVTAGASSCAAADVG